MRLTLEDDKQVDETWLELVLGDVWDMVKRVRRKSGKKQESYSLWFGTTKVEITVSRARVAPNDY